MPNLQLAKVDNAPLNNEYFYFYYIQRSFVESPVCPKKVPRMAASTSIPIMSHTLALLDTLSKVHQSFTAIAQAPGLPPFQNVSVSYVLFGISVFKYMTLNPACPANTYKSNTHLDSPCQKCPPNTHTVTPGSSSVDQCICNHGYKSDDQGVCQGR